MESLHELPNIGGILEQKLVQVGIRTPQQLRELGSKEAFLKIRRIDHTACLHMLTALEGAVQGVRKTELSSQVKAELRAFYNSL